MSAFSGLIRISHRSDYDASASCEVELFWELVLDVLTQPNKLSPFFLRVLDEESYVAILTTKLATNVRVDAQVVILERGLR